MFYECVQAHNWPGYDGKWLLFSTVSLLVGCFTCWHLSPGNNFPYSFPTKVIHFFLHTSRMYNFYGPCIAPCPSQSISITGLWDGLFCKVFLYFPNPGAIALVRFKSFRLVLTCGSVFRFITATVISLGAWSWRGTLELTWSILQCSFMSIHISAKITMLYYQNKVQHCDQICII